MILAMGAVVERTPQDQRGASLGFRDNFVSIDYSPPELQVGRDIDEGRLLRLAPGARTHLEHFASGGGRPRLFQRKTIAVL